ncbi:hypothetical protein Q644_13465, partial [Brucella intermedia 229E]
MTNKDKDTSRSTGNLVAKVSEQLRRSIQSGEITPGTKLPSEARLTESFGVSRTVIREAIAALRADRLVEARQGAGVFVLEPQPPETVPFQNLDYDGRNALIVKVLEGNCFRRLRLEHKDTRTLPCFHQPV